MIQQRALNYIIWSQVCIARAIFSPCSECLWGSPKIQLRLLVKGPEAELSNPSRGYYFHMISKIYDMSFDMWINDNVKTIWSSMTDFF